MIKSNIKIKLNRNFSVYKCKFCNEPCAYVTGAIQRSFGNTKFWECYNHQHTVRFFILADIRAKYYPHLQVGDIVTHSIELWYNNALYDAKWNIPNKWNKSFHLDKYIHSASCAQDCTQDYYHQSSPITVFSTNDAPSNVTPENIHEKLPIWLMLI